MYINFNEPSWQQNIEFLHTHALYSMLKFDNETVIPSHHFSTCF